MLEKIVGSGNVVARVSAKIATDSETITSETYPDENPIEMVKTKSTERTSEPNTNPGGPAGVTPNTATGGPNVQLGDESSTKFSSEKIDETTEFALSKTMSNKVILPGKIEDLTAAVFVNRDPDADDNIDITVLQNAAVLALGPYVQDPTKVQVNAAPFDTKARTDIINAVSSSNFWDRFWDVGKSLIYVALAGIGLFMVMRTFKRTSEEFIPTGMTVGEIMAGGLSPEGAPLPAGAVAGDNQAAASTAAVPPASGDGSDVEMITEEKKKLVMDFGLGEEQPERVTVEVLKDLISEKPDKMSKAARSWLLSGDNSTATPDE